MSIADLVVAAEGPSQDWVGILCLDGEPVMGIGRGPDGGFLATHPHEDDASVLALLEEHVSSTGEPVDLPDGSSRPETLEDRVASLVAVGWLIRHVAALMDVCVLANVGGDMTQTRIPPGGTLQGAIDHVRSMHPEAVILNEMPIEQAALAFADAA